MTKVLIVDDEKSIRKTLREILEFEKYDVQEAADGMECLVALKRDSFDLIILDIKMPNLDGMETLERIQILAPDVPVIMISGHGTIDTAVDAVKTGAFDFVCKPPDLNRLLITVRNALEKKTLIVEKKHLQRKVNQTGRKTEIIGESEKMLHLKSMIEQVAPSDARVLVTGPNGAGKELVARSMHERSDRASQQLIEVNCAAIPSELIESELFGHEKGSFTSAVKQHIGKFEQASGGTLFLDEIGDMSLSAQAKVLRALQESRITRVGGDKEIKVDVRVIAATNKDLRKEIARGRFREDLYHRLAVIILQVPRLADRRDDIPLLIEHFNQQIAQEYDLPPKKFPQEAMEALQALPWTGNIRELRNVIERLMILCGDEVTEKNVFDYVYSSAHESGRLEDLFDQFENVDKLVDFVAERYKEHCEQ